MNDLETKQVDVQGLTDVFGSRGRYHSLFAECSSWLYHQRFTPVKIADSTNTVDKKYSKYLFMDLKKSWHS